MQAGCAQGQALTVVSLDASAAYDGTSRQTILHELRHLPEAAALLPFARLWLGRPSSFVWQQGPVSQSISQAEGGMRLASPLTACKVCSLTVACGSVTRRLYPHPAAWCCSVLPSVRCNSSQITSSLWVPDTGNSCTCCRALVTRRSPGCCCYTPRPREPSLQAI